jgi:hypothetical protein
MSFFKRKSVAYIIAALISLAVFYTAVIMLPAWEARYRAGRVLGCVREFHPGITSEMQARERMKPLAKYESSEWEDHDGLATEQVTYTFINCAAWICRVLGMLPDSWVAHLTLPWTMFEVTVAYQNGVVSALRIAEMQQDIPGMPHPNAATTTVISSRLGQHLSFMPPPESDFTGYSTKSQSTGSVDEDGKWTGFSCCHERWVMLDERATSIQLADALNFQLHCLTSVRRCKDDRAILP